MKSPCRPDCPDRNSDCHGTCKAYQAYWQEKLIQYDQRKIRKESENPSRGYLRYMHARTLRKKSGHK